MEDAATLNSSAEAKGSAEGTSAEREPKKEAPSTSAYINSWSSWLTQTVQQTVQETVKQTSSTLNYQALTEKSNAFVESCKKDFKEFVDTMSENITETSTTASEAVSSIKAKESLAVTVNGASNLVKKVLEKVPSSVKEGISSVASDVYEGVQELVTATGLSPTSSESKQRNLSDNSTSQIPNFDHVADPKTQFIVHLIKNPSLFESDPANIGNFTCNVAEHTSEISQLLSKDDEFRAFHGKLVPSKVTYDDFWRRYFYQIHQFEVELAKRKEIVSTVAESLSPPPTAAENEEITASDEVKEKEEKSKEWDLEGDELENVTVTKEQEDELLADKSPGLGDDELEEMLKDVVVDEGAEGKNVAESTGEWEEDWDKL